MSNLLQKLFIETNTVIPGYTVQRWVPAVTTTYILYTGRDSTGATVTVRSDEVGSLSYIGDNLAIALQRVNGWEVVPILSQTSVDETVPGYWSTDSSPDSYSTSYDPNIGWNAGARSGASALGDVACTFTVPLTVVGVIVGLTNISDPFAGEYRHIDHSFVFTSGLLRIVDRDLLISAGAYVSKPPQRTPYHFHLSLLQWTRYLP